MLVSVELVASSGSLHLILELILLLLSFAVFDGPVDAVHPDYILGEVLREQVEDAVSRHKRDLVLPAAAHPLRQHRRVGRFHLDNFDDLLVRDLCARLKGTLVV